MAWIAATTAPLTLIQYTGKPLTREEIQEKFYQCAGEQIPKKRAKKFVEALLSIERVDVLAPWLKLLRPARR